jgi:hypothetical protein
MHRIIAAILLLSATLAAQSPPPGNIKLLSGYEHAAAKGNDSGKAGTIQRPKGLHIEYGIGMGSKLANTADYSDGAGLIYEESSIAGRPVRFISELGTGDRLAEIFFTRDKLRFRATYKDVQQLGELLLTALSYPARPSQPGFLRIPFRRIKLEKDPANTLITHGQVTHTVGSGSRGSIRQRGEPEIHYQVGAPPAPLSDWTLHQNFIGHPVTVSYGTPAGETVPALQVVFMPQPGADADPVTFRSPVRNDREFVHVMMTVLTYHQ